MTLTRSFSEPPVAFGEQSLRARQAERSASTFDLEGGISKRHFYGASAAGSSMSPHEASRRHATMDIDACSRRKAAPVSARGARPEGSGLRGWNHTSYDVPARVNRKHFWQPFSADGYGNVTNTSRRAAFDQSVRAEEYAMLLGRPRSHREHPKRCSNTSLQQACRNPVYMHEELPSPLGLRRVLKSMLPEDSHLSRQLEIVATHELHRQGAATTARVSNFQMCKARIQNRQSPNRAIVHAHMRRSPRAVNVNAPASTQDRNALREQTAGPTLLRSAARQQKMLEKRGLPKPSPVSETDNVANLLLQESERLRQESEKLMAKAERLQYQADLHQESQILSVCDNANFLGTSMCNLETIQEHASRVEQ